LNGIEKQDTSILTIKADALKMRDDKESVENEVKLRRIIVKSDSTTIKELAKATMKLASMQQGEEKEEMLKDAIKMYDIAMVRADISVYSKEGHDEKQKIMESIISETLDCHKMLHEDEKSRELEYIDKQMIDEQVTITRLKILISEINPKSYLGSAIYGIDTLQNEIKHYKNEYENYKVLINKPQKELTKEEKEQIKNWGERCQGWENDDTPTTLGLLGSKYYIKLLETWWERTSNYNHSSPSINKDFLFLISPKEIKYHFEKTLGGKRLNDEIYNLDLLRELLKEVIHDDKREYHKLRENNPRLMYQPLEWAEEMAKELDVTELKEKLKDEDMTRYKDVCQKEDFIAIDRKRLDNPIDFTPMHGMFPLMNDNN
jgi:hypothetical protein